MKKSQNICVHSAIHPSYNCRTLQKKFLTLKISFVVPFPRFSSFSLRGLLWLIGNVNRSCSSCDDPARIGPTKFLSTNIFWKLRTSLRKRKTVYGMRVYTLALRIRWIWQINRFRLFRECHLVWLSTSVALLCRPVDSHAVPAFESTGLQARSYLSWQSNKISFSEQSQLVDLPKSAACVMLPYTLAFHNNYYAVKFRGNFQLA